MHTNNPPRYSTVFSNSSPLRCLQAKSLELYTLISAANNNVSGTYHMSYK